MMQWLREGFNTSKFLEYLLKLFLHLSVSFIRPGIFTFSIICFLFWSKVLQLIGKVNNDVKTTIAIGLDLVLSLFLDLAVHIDRFIFVLN